MSKGWRKNKFTFWREHRRALSGFGPQARWLCCSLLAYHPGYSSSLAPRQRAWGPAAKCEVILAPALRARLEITGPSRRCDSDPGLAFYERLDHSYLVIQVSSMKDPKPSTRERIIQAAVELFYAHGYAGTGMAEILEKANANSGSFYFFFTSKEDLLMTVLDWYQQNLRPMLLAPVFKRSKDPVKRIFLLLEKY
ncbi:MAG TPA: TetR/AcrR family transcriptional regulator, partial [Acidobacteriota bacterium]|nr:TetR/AcrR family transcriptional regulator [Acidobacteriota bacterium]